MVIVSGLDDRVDVVVLPELAFIDVGIARGISLPLHFGRPLAVVPGLAVADVEGTGAGGGIGGGRAYNSVQRFAVRSCCCRFRVYSVAIEGTRGSWGFGSVSSDDSESMTLKRESAGDQFCLRMSMQIPPLSEMFMWYILVAKVTFGAVNG